VEAPELPCNETGRLAALQRLQILDTATEQRFDRYTRLACKLFDVPIALISLVDKDRQWFKSRHGLDATETPRDISFCGHAILQKSVFEINNATQDKRFHDNPLVTGELHLRFYAGAPLVSPGGHNLGTLCLIDHEPRSLDSDQRESLMDLANMVSDEITAFVDELTGLANRRGFNIAVENVLHNVDYGTDMASLVLFDLDHFKEINDTHGHQAGDHALQKFAELMTEVFRKSDIVCRLGGDEFCVLLANASEKIARDRISILRERVERENQESGLPYQIEFSAGVCSTQTKQGRISINNIMSEADRLLYANKAQKRLHAV